MSAHYNRVMMRQLREPLIELLKKLSATADQVAKGEVVPEKLAGWESAEELTNSFKMVNCLAMAKLSQTLGEALQGVANAARRGWSDDQARQVAQRAKTQADAFIPLIEDLAKGADVLPAALWPYWADLLRQMNEPVPDPVVLFEPAADFDDMVFSRLDPDYLKDVVHGATRRLEEGLNKVRSAERNEHPAEFAQALGQVQEVFDWAYRTPHRRGFQPYWLIVRARLVDARLHADEHVRAPDTIYRLIRNGNLELQRFGANARTVAPERLQEDIAPLLTPWDETARANEVMKELRDRFGLDAFWSAASQVNEKKGHPVGQVNGNTRAELIALHERVSDAWARWYAATGDMKDVIRAYAGLVMRTSDFPAESRNLIKALLVTMEWTAKRPNDDRDMDVGNEISAGLVTLGDVLVASPAQLPGLVDRIDQQTRRLRAVMVPGRVEYQQLPIIRWGAQRMRQETQQARQKAMAQMVKLLEEIEETLDNVIREETDVKDVKVLLSDVQNNLDVAAAALGLLRMPQHERLIRGLRQRLARLLDRPVLLQDETERQPLTVALPAIMASLSNHMEGHVLDDDEELLAKASAVILNEAPSGSKQASEWESAQPVVSPSPVEVGAPQPGLVEEDREEIPVVPSPEPDLPVEATTEPLPTDEQVLSESARVGIPAMSKEAHAALLGPAGYTDTLDRADPDILEGFFQEAAMVVADVAGWRHTLLDNPTDEAAWEDLRRAFHTVKGSGRFVCLIGLTEVAWWLERFVDLHLKAGEAYSPALDRVVAQGQAWLNAGLEELRLHRKATLRAAHLWATLVDFQTQRVHELASDPLPLADMPVQTAPHQASSLAHWAQDPEARDAVQEDLRRRRQELMEVVEGHGQDMDLLQRIAHTLRTLGNALGLVRWEKECAEVERYLAKKYTLTEDQVLELVDRWLPVIDDLHLADAHPEASLTDDWRLPVPPLVPDHLGPEVTLTPGASDVLSVEAAPAVPVGEEETWAEEEAEDFDLQVITPSFDPEPDLEPDLAPTQVAEEVSFHEEEPAPSVPALEDPHEALSSSPEWDEPTFVEKEETPAPPVEVASVQREKEDVDRESLWDEVFQAHSLLMEGGRRLGEALKKLLEAEEDEEI